MRVKTRDHLLQAEPSCFFSKSRVLFVNSRRRLQGGRHDPHRPHARLELKARTVTRRLVYPACSRALPSSSGRGGSARWWGCRGAPPYGDCYVARLHAGGDSFSLSPFHFLDLASGARHGRDKGARPENIRGQVRCMQRGTKGRRRTAMHFWPCGDRIGGRGKK